MCTNLHVVEENSIINIDRNKKKHRDTGTHTRRIKQELFEIQMHWIGCWFLHKSCNFQKHILFRNLRIRTSLIQIAMMYSIVSISSSKMRKNMCVRLKNDGSNGE